MKKLFTLFLLLCAFLQAEGYVYTDRHGVVWTFTIDGSETTITGCSSTTGNMVIPSKVQIDGRYSEYTVTGIGADAFNGCTDLTGVQIPSGVTSIGLGAFDGCTGLTTVGINSNAIMSKDYTYTSSFKTIFGDQVTNYVIGNSVTGIGEYAFYHCSNMTSVTIPSMVSSIGKSAFKGCDGLTSITIPEGVSTIGEEAFYDCSELTSVTIPESVTSIGNHAFYGCGLTQVTINSDAIISTDYDSEWSLYDIFSNYVKTYVIGEGVTSIGSYAFYGCSNMTSVTIPSTVTSIGNHAFDDCGLPSVVIPSGVTSIGKYAFYCCSDLTSVTFPSTVISIGESAFKNCRSLTSVTIPSGVTSISDGTFLYCFNLASVTIPSTVTSIGSDAFAYSESLESVTIPASVTSIGGSAFYSCGCTSIQVESGNPVYDSRYDCNAIIETESNTLIQGCATTVIPDDVIAIADYAFGGLNGLTSMTIPPNVTSIGKSAFQRCANLASITIPSSVAIISENMFLECKALTDVTISEGVTSIGESAFWKCESLASITIPSSVSSIGKWAFGGCPLTSVTCYNPTPISINSNVFSCYDTATLYVPEGCVEAYRGYSEWFQFRNILTIPVLAPGDVNGDQNVDVADFMAVANYILNNPVENFNPAVADVAGSAEGGPDGVIDVADFMGIANIILHKDAQGVAPKKAAKAPRKAATDIDALDNAIYVEPVTAAPGTQQVLSVRMKNTAAVSAFEFNLQLPEGITVASDAVGVLAELSTERTTARKTSYFGASVQDDGTLKVLCGTTVEDPSTGKPYAFEGNEGEVALITIEVPEDYEEGVYEVSVIDGKISNPEGDKTDLDSPITTELTIGDTTVVLDENSTDDIPATSAAVPVKVLRTFKQDTWSTVCFPFAMTGEQLSEVFGDDVEIKDFVDYEVEDDADDNITAIRVHFEDFDPADGLEANYPVLLKTHKADFDEFTLTTVLEPDEENATIEYDNGKQGSRRVVYGTLQGVYKKTAVPENCLFISENKFWYSTGATTMKAFRAYFDFVDLLSDVENAGANIQMVFDKTTGISEKVTVNGEESDAWYTLDGMKLNKKPTQKGVYIFNGKKIVVK